MTMTLGVFQKMSAGPWRGRHLRLLVAGRHWRFSLPIRGLLGGLALRLRRRGLHRPRSVVTSRNARAVSALDACITVVPVGGKGMRSFSTTFSRDNRANHVLAIAKSAIWERTWNVREFDTFALDCSVVLKTGDVQRHLKRRWLFYDLLPAHAMSLSFMR